MTEPSAARAWIAAYRRAWETYREGDIRALFTDDAVYRAHPWEDGVVGLDAIVAAWLAVRDDARDTTFEVLEVNVDGDRAFIRGVSGYPRFDDVWENLFVVDLAQDGRARRFTGWDIKRPHDEDAASS
jgi:SnoaL-like domain